MSENENIFDTNCLYPGYDDSLKYYFRNHFDSVFISFSPFFEISGDGYSNVRRSKILSLEELQEKDQIFKKLKPNGNRVIYTNDNADYPDVNTIIAQANTVRWQYILEHAKFHNYQEISLALQTSIGGLNKEFERKDLLEKLDRFTEENAIFHPTEGRITLLSLVKIYNCFKTLGQTMIVVTDEFFEDRKTIDITSITSSEFALSVRGYMYYFPVDRSLLFTIEWDSFFYLICGNEKLLKTIVPMFEFEGFICDDKTMHSWDLGA